tara:strand:- start:315 stop:509 length:195 start_codon:yes stop_codon:yes gene_type:complete
VTTLVVVHEQSFIPAAFGGLLSGAVLTFIGVTPTTGTGYDLVLVLIFLATPFAIGWGVIKLDAD